MLQIAPEFPVLASAANETSGQCGEHIFWTLDAAGTLTISGEGAMYDYHLDQADLSFSANQSIQSVIIEEGITSIGSYAFYHCTALNAVVLPDSLTSIAEYAFFGTALETVEIPDAVSRIDAYAFANCGALVSAVIPDSVAHIGSFAFLDCSSLTSVQLPASITRIENGAFQGCSSLTAIALPDSVISIGNTAFSGCAALPSVSLPDTVTSIGDAAFSNCTTLTSVSLPTSVQSIGDSAFFGCTALTNVYFSGMAQQWNAISIAPYNEPLNTAILHFSKPSLAGDFNGDGMISVADAVLLARFTAEDYRLTAAQRASILAAEPDVDGDGLITALDVCTFLFEQ